MKDGAILANAGHFDVEIDTKTLLEKARSVKPVRPNVDEVVLPGGKRVYLLAKGRIVNLVAAEGHPPEVMQMSFANQFMSALYVLKNHEKLEQESAGRPSGERERGRLRDARLPGDLDRQARPRSSSSTPRAGNSREADL